MVLYVGLNTRKIRDKDKFRMAQEAFQTQCRAESMVCESPWKLTPSSWEFHECGLDQGIPFVIVYHAFHEALTPSIGRVANRKSEGCGTQGRSSRKTGDDREGSPSIGPAAWSF